jgi:hypothetical protein
MALPMYGLYEGGLIMARVLNGMKRKDEDDEGGE